MSNLDHHLRRLLSAAAAAPRPPTADSAPAPDARALLRARDRELAQAERTTSRVVRLGFATACVLLAVTLLISVRQIDRANRDVFAVSEMALTRISTP